jgi:hypothetical protein
MAVEFEIVRLNNLSGTETTIYSIRLLNNNFTIFENFILENRGEFKSEIKNIINRLDVIGKKTGAREYYFKLNEGNPGDGVAALFDRPKNKLRLYCIRYGMNLIILGGGGPKPKNIVSFQDNEKLKNENYIIREVSKKIKERTVEKDINFINEGKDLNGNLLFVYYD